MIAPADVPAHLPALRRVSDDWLAHKAAAEKGFSLGFFDEAYVRRFPVGVIERGGADPGVRHPVAGRARVASCRST